MTHATETVPTLLTDELRERAATELQAMLVELIDLSLQAKQAHWNVVGPNFRPLHELFDDLVDAYRSWTDVVAERLAAIGVPPKGQVGAVSQGASFDPLPEGTIEDCRLVILFADRLGRAAAAARARMERLGEVDLVSQDLLLDIVHGLEKQRWMLAAQRS